MAYEVNPAQAAAFTAALHQLSRDSLQTDSNPELVPVPLTAEVWSRAVFRRGVPASQLLVAILTDVRAALLCRGLAALDDETLQYLAEHSGVLTEIYDRAAGPFAAFADALQVRDGRIVVPGGDEAAGLWESIVAAPVAEPDQFIVPLFERSGGRLAYVYGTVAQFDAPRVRFALGLWIPEPSQREERFRAFVREGESWFREWNLLTMPAVRPMYDLGMLLFRVRTAETGEPAAPSSRGLWARVFQSAELPEKPDADLRDAGAQGAVDAAWLADNVLDTDSRTRGERMDQFAFAQRVFGSVQGTSGDLYVALRSFVRYRTLALTLERIGIADPSVYAFAARHARRLATFDDPHASTTAMFQGALNLVAHLTAVRTVDPSTAERLVRDLIALPTSDARVYTASLGRWLGRDLRAALPPADFYEDALAAGLAGLPDDPEERAPVVAWEGQDYRLSVAASERRRLERIRDRQGGVTLDEVVPRAAAGARAASPLLAEALIAWAYALDLGDPDGTALLGASVAARHDFGTAVSDREMRVRNPWTLPKQEIAVGASWHVKGSILGLDVALAPLLLRRTVPDRMGSAPSIAANQRDVFAAGVSLMNPMALSDHDRDEIAAAIERGSARVSELADREELEAVASQIGMDGWRRRAMRWTADNEPQRITELFSLAELLELGGDTDGADLDAWGMPAFESNGCLCRQFTRAHWWFLFSARPRLGAMAATMPDLNLRVAMTLRDLQLPAALAKEVLRGAVQDLVEEARPIDSSDWLTLVRTAQAVSSERIEDYLAAATADGPLVPEAASSRP